MKLPQSFIDELKGRLRTSEVVGRKVQLRRAGREFIGLCPFHKEKSPSFSVNDEKGFYHCFGCGAHGDVISFFKETEALSYREAVERAASLAGMAMPIVSRAESEREERVESLQQVVEAATRWFEAQLEGGEGRLAREYLVQRGIHPETIAKFRIGYAPENRDAMAQALQARGITPAQLIEAGLLIKVDGRAPYARFRRRLMFPIRDRKSRVVAFGGRVLPGEPSADAPKYLNSPETPLFHKGRMLYNLDLARKAALDGKQLIVAEGYMDVIALAQGGFAHAVAPLGTAITPEQLQLCWQMVDAPLLALDGDNAGERAMLRAAHLALPLLVPGKSLSFARLPTGEDPDSLLKKSGRKALEELFTQAFPLAEALLWEALRVSAETPEAKAAREHQLMQLAEQIKEPLVRQHYRSFFREKLWQRKSGKPTDLPNIARLSAPEATDMAALFLALVLRLPSLLSEGNAEERFLALEVGDALKPLYQSMTAILLQEPDISSEALIAALREDHPTDVARILQLAASQGLREGLDHTQTSMLAQHWWPFVVNKQDHLRLLRECALAEAELAENVSDETLTRLTALTTQKQAIEREIARFYNEDPLEV
jgi:DNA primase